MTKRFLIILASLFVSIILPAQNVDKEVVALQMNSCVMSLTNLNESQNLATYEKERENLINNLSKEGMARLPEITDLRESILATIYQLEITQEEREVLKRIKSLERNSSTWRSISNGLNQAMVFVPGRGVGGAQQAAFYALLTAARSAVDYSASSTEARSEEEKALWEIRKQDLKQYAWLNTEAYKKINEVFRTYQLGDTYELTPRQASEFNKLISDQDAGRRIQKLKNSSDIYKYLNEYNYYLGMAYVELDEYKKASLYFDKYLSNAKKARIYKIDDKLGCIYLSKLIYEPNLSPASVELYISEALRNLPHNGAAYIQCATIFCTRLNDKEKAFTILRDALYDDMLTDKEAVMMTITEWIPQLKQSSLFDNVYDTICSSIEDNRDYISLNSYLSFLISSANQRSWEEIERLITVGPVNGKIGMKGPYAIKLAKNLGLKIDHIFVFGEVFKKDKLTVDEGQLSYTKGYSQAYLEKKFSLFKSSPELIYLFFDYNSDGRCFYVKRSLTKDDFNKLTKIPYEFEGLKAFPFDFTDKSSRDRKELQKIIDFCRKNQKRSPSEIILYGKAKGNVIHTKGEIPYIDNYFTGENSISYVPYIDFQNIEADSSSVKYKVKINIQKGSQYKSCIPRDFGEKHLRVTIKGSQNDDIELLYLVEGTEVGLIAYGDSNAFTYRVPIQVISSESNQNYAQPKSIKFKKLKGVRSAEGEGEEQGRKNAVENDTFIGDSVVAPSKTSIWERFLSIFKKSSENESKALEPGKKPDRHKKEAVVKEKDSKESKGANAKGNSETTNNNKLTHKENAQEQMRKKGVKGWWYSIFHKDRHENE